ncbi:DUF1194 domain-containing protein, partial [Rhizobium leguminosarum]|uniref:DUF1194 domain-containing protein n=1 Tax=Rhizobium leguminosarum TaxID=384 RepID=UPI003F946527
PLRRCGRSRERTDDPSGLRASTEAGMIINGLAIMLRPSDAPNGLEKYYADCVIGGPGAFVLPVRKIEDFAVAVRRKLVLEISDL